MELKLKFEVGQIVCRTQGLELIENIILKIRVDIYSAITIIYVLGHIVSKSYVIEVPEKLLFGSKDECKQALIKRINNL